LFTDAEQGEQSDVKCLMDVVRVRALCHLLSYSPCPINCSRRVVTDNVVIDLTTCTVLNHPCVEAYLNTAFVSLELRTRPNHMAHTHSPVWPIWQVTYDQRDPWLLTPIQSWQCTWKAQYVSVSLL